MDYCFRCTFLLFLALFSLFHYTTGGGGDPPPDPLTWISPSGVTESGDDYEVTIQIPENQAVDTSFLTLNTTGEPAVTLYELIDDADGVFILNENDQLQIISALDFETTTNYTIVVRFKDTEKDKYLLTITVDVLDINEAPIIEENMYVVTVADGAEAGTLVTTLTATDEDAGDELSFNIDSGNINFMFRIKDDELLVATGKKTNAIDQQGYLLEISVSDGSLQDDTKVLVFVHSCPKSSGILLSASYTGMIITTAMALIVIVYVN